MDPIAAMLGLGTENEQDLKALAESLRGRQKAADFFALSTVPQIAKGAQGEQSSILEGATRGGLHRQRGLQRALQQSMQDERISAQDARALQQDEAYMEREQLRQNQLNARNDADNAAKPGGLYNAPTTQKERAAFDKGAEDAVNMSGLLSSFKDEYAIEGLDVPFTGNITNMLGRATEGIAPGDWSEKASWWSDYKRHAELVQRHGLFGSALTSTEQSEWQKATTGPNDGPIHVREKLEKQAAFTQKKAIDAAARALNRNYDPKEVQMNFGDAVDVEGLMQGLADGSYMKDLTGRQQADREDLNITDMPDFDGGADGKYTGRTASDREGNIMRELTDGTWE